MYIPLIKSKLQTSQSVSIQSKEYWIRQLNILPEERFKIYVNLLVNMKPLTIIEGRQLLINKLPWEKWLGCVVENDQQYDILLKALNEVYIIHKSILADINVDLPDDN